MEYIGYDNVCKYAYDDRNNLISDGCIHGFPLSIFF